MTTLRDIPLDQIIIGDRLRQIDPDWVVTLQDSVRAREAQMQPPLIHPITVRPQDDAFILVTGGHRVAAIKGLGHSTIQAIVQNLTDAEARLEEIDENLIRRNLTAFDRAAFLAERRAVYEALHPETRKGRKGALARWHDTTGKLPLAFTADAAERTGLDVSVVRKVLKAHDALCPAVRSQIPGSWIADNDAQLQALARLGPDMQAAVVEKMLSDHIPVAAAVAAIEGRQTSVISPEDQTFLALVKAWDRSEGFPAARERFLTQFGLKKSPRRKGDEP